MILLCGLPSDAPFATMTAQVSQLGVPAVVFDQRDVAASTLEWTIRGGEVSGRFDLAGRSYRFEECCGVYLRLMDDRRRPELTEVPEADVARLDRIRWCPTPFQAFVEGTNVRVHVVHTSVLATAIQTQATDYRYAARQRHDTTLHAIELPAALTERCISLAQALDLAFAGIDLKITPDHHVYCVEVNPSPAFSYYEAHTGQPIAQTVAQYLAGTL